MPIPALGAMQADINFIGRPDELIGQARSAAGAEDDPCLAEGAVDLLIPPAGVPEFHDVAARGIELADNVIEPGLGVAIARRQLKQKAAHPVAEDIGDHPKILHESLRALELLDMGDELADLDGVNELFLAGLAAPGLNAGDRRP